MGTQKAVLSPNLRELAKTKQTIRAYTKISPPITPAAMRIVDSSAMVSWGQMVLAAKKAASPNPRLMA